MEETSERGGKRLTRKVGEVRVEERIIKEKYTRVTIQMSPHHSIERRAEELQRSQ